MVSQRLFGWQSGLMKHAAIEGRRLFFIFMYLWAILSILAIHKWNFGVGGGFITEQLEAIATAFILAKVIFIGERLEIGDIFPTRPLIYVVIVKSAIFAVILLSSIILKRSVIAVLNGGSISEGLLEIGGGRPAHMLATGLVTSILLMPFFSFRELSKAIGSERIYQLLFYNRNKR